MLDNDTDKLCNFPGEVKSTTTDNVEHTTCNSVCETNYYCPGDLWKQKRTEFVNVTCSSEGYISSMNSVWSPWSSCYCVDGCTENPGGL